MKNVFFLIYVSRSGSTLLARLLDEYSDTGVTIESRFMMDLLFLKHWFEKKGDIEELFRRLERSGKFSNFNIKFEDLMTFYDGKKKISSVAEAILESYFAREKAESCVWVVKDSINGYYMKQILNEMPYAKFIHIVRDGRAVLNSWLTTIDPYTKKPMSFDTLNTARSWKKLLVSVDKFKEEHPESIIEIRYEDLITNTAGEIGKIRMYLGLTCQDTNTKKAGTGNYYDKLPKPEKEIHGMVKGSPELSRLYAWEKDLPIEDRKLFEYIAGDMLIKKGYEVDLKPSLYEIITTPSLRNLFLACSIKRANRRIKYATDFKLLRTVLKTEYLRKR